MPADDRLKIVRDCYGAYESGDRRILEGHLADDFRFYSPPDPGIDRAPYFQRCWPNSELISGSQSSNGLDMLRGAQLAVREANARGGVLGRRIAIVRADDKGDQANARRVARTAIKRKVAAVIGPFNSSVGIVNLPIYLRN